MLCAYTRPRYQVSVYRTIGPLVLFSSALFVYLVLLPILRLFTIKFNGFGKKYQRNRVRQRKQKYF